MFLKLHLMKFEIKALVGNEFFVSTHFFYFAFVEHYNFTGLANGAQAVGNYNGGSAGDELIDGFLYK